MHDREPTIADLPETARVFADIIGFESTLALAARCNFEAIVIPRSISKSHWIAKVIGLKPAQKLALHFSGCHMPLASCKAVAVAVRQRKASKAYRTGTSPAVIADLLGVTVRTVLNDLYATGARQPAPVVKAKAA